MRKAARRAMLIERVAVQATVIRFVVADDEGRVLTEMADHRLRDAGILVPQEGYLPGTAGTPPVGGEGVHGKNDRHDASLQHGVEAGRDRRVIRPMKALDTPGDLDGVHLGIAGNDRTIGEAHDQGRVANAPIGIDQKARIARQNGRRREMRRKGAGDIPGAYVPADMALKLTFRQPKAAIFGRQGVGSVIAQDEKTAGGVSLQDFEGLE
jgi:hypothetical protein